MSIEFTGLSEIGTRYQTEASKNKATKARIGARYVAEREDGGSICLNASGHQIIIGIPKRLEESAFRCAKVLIHLKKSN